MIPFFLIILILIIGGENHLKKQHETNYVTRLTGRQGSA